MYIPIASSPCKQKQVSQGNCTGCSQTATPTRLGAKHKLPQLFSGKTPAVAQLSQQVSTDPLPSSSFLLSLFIQPHHSPALGTGPGSHRCQGSTSVPGDELFSVQGSSCPPCSALVWAKPWGALRSKPHKAEHQVAFSGYPCSSSTCAPPRTLLQTSSCHEVEEKRLFFSRAGAFWCQSSTITNCRADRGCAKTRRTV